MQKYLNVEIFEILIPEKELNIVIPFLITYRS